MDSYIPISVQEYIDTQLLGSAKTLPLTNDLKSVGALQYNNNIIIYGIMVPNIEKNIAEVVQQGGRTRLSKNISKCLKGENLGNWIMLAKPTHPDYQKFLQYIVMQAYEENNNTDNKSLMEIEKEIRKSFLEEQKHFTTDDKVFLEFVKSRNTFYEGKLDETRREREYYDEIKEIIERTNQAIK